MQEENPTEEALRQHRRAIDILHHGPERRTSQTPRCYYFPIKTCFIVSAAVALSTFFIIKSITDAAKDKPNLAMLVPASTVWIAIVAYFGYRCRTQQRPATPAPIPGEARGIELTHI